MTIEELQSYELVEKREIEEPVSYTHLMTRSEPHTVRTAPT